MNRLSHSAFIPHAGQREPAPAPVLARSAFTTRVMSLKPTGKQFSQSDSIAR